MTVDSVSLAYVKIKMRNQYDLHRRLVKIIKLSLGSLVHSSGKTKIL